MLPLLKTSAHQLRRPSKQSDQPGAKYSREQEDVPASTGKSPVTTSRLQQQQATSGAYMRASRNLLDQPRAKKHPWKPAAVKWSPTKLSRWRDGWNTTQSSTPERRLLSPQQWTPLPIMEELEAIPTLQEIGKAINSLTYSKAPGNDGILQTWSSTERPPFCSLYMTPFVKCWSDGGVPQDTRDARIVTLCKNKGDKSNCNSYRGISLLSIVGKLYARVLLSASSTASGMRLPRVLKWLSSRTFYSGDTDDPLPSPNAAEVQGTADVPLNCLHRSGGEGEGLESFRKFYAKPRNFVLQQRSKSSTIQNRVQNIRKCLQKVNYA